MIKKSLFLYLLLLAFLSCNKNKIGEYISRKYTQFSLGTIIEITVLYPYSQPRDSISKVIKGAFNIFENIDKKFYEKNKESYTYLINRLKNKEIMKIPKDLYNMIKRSFIISNKTSGYFDITVGTYYKQYSFGQETKKEPNVDSLKVLSKVVGYSNLLLKDDYKISKRYDNLEITVGGIAKGYAVDSVKKYLKRFKFVKGAIINAGGDIGLIKRADGRKWRIGVRHPRKPGDIIKVLSLSDESVATSGDYENYYIVGGKRYHHLLDPFTGLSSYNCQSVTVIAHNTELADALATAFFVAGYEKSKEWIKNFNNVYAMWVVDSANIFISDGFVKYWE